METDAVQLLQGVRFIMSEVWKESFYRIVRLLMIKYIYNCFENAITDFKNKKEGYINYGDFREIY